MLKKKSGFIIVELLIVIVVVGILAAISIVAYNGIQNRANNSIVTGDISSLAKILELYKVDYGQYPVSGTVINGGVGKFKVSGESAYAQSPQSRTNLTVCFSLDGSATAVAAMSASGQAYYAYSGDSFALKEMTAENWVSSSDLAFERCQSIDPNLSPIRPGYGTYMNFNGYSISDTERGPWRDWTRGE